jgi:hypothetical protein
MGNETLHFHRIPKIMYKNLQTGTLRFVKYAERNLLGTENMGNETVHLYTENTTKKTVSIRICVSNFNLNISGNSK